MLIRSFFATLRFNMAFLLDGKALGATIREKVKVRVATFSSPPTLAVILVGDDPASHLYVSLKQQACEEAGIGFELFRYTAEMPEEELLNIINELNAREEVTGILVQLPLPTQNADRIIAAIHPNKDVDGFHPENLRHLEAGEPGIVPALELGIMKLLSEALKTLPHPSSALIVGSAFFARPLLSLLKEIRVQATNVSADDASLDEKTRAADLLIVAVGRPGLMTKEMVKPGAIVIDVGTTRLNGRTVGDVSEDVSEVAAALTPVPGGVGPMTVAMLLLNILKARELQKR